MLWERASARKKKMPTSIGHAIAGVAAGWAVVTPAADRRARWVQAGIFAAVAAAPDLDLIVNRHRSETHSLGAAAIVATISAWRLWPVAATRGRIWLSIFAAYATHLVLDTLALDQAPPIGIMAFWPVSRAYVETGLEVFAPVWRRWWLASFYTHNSVAVVREVAILAPILLGVGGWRRSSRPT